MAHGGAIRLRPSGEGRPVPAGPSVSNAAGRGVAGTAATVLMATVGVVVFVFALLVIATLFVVAIAAALMVTALHGLVHALSPRSSGRPVPPGGFRPAAVIEGTATVIRRAAPKPRA